MAAETTRLNLNSDDKGKPRRDRRAEIREPACGVGGDLASKRIRQGVAFRQQQVAEQLATHEAYVVDQPLMRIDRFAPSRSRH